MRRKSMRRAFLAGVVSVGLLAACQDHNQIALQVGAVSPDGPRLRAAQTLNAPGVAETQLLAEATQVLQDLGFALEESSAPYGLLVGSKDRDAVEAGQVAAAVALTVVGALFLVPVVPSWDQHQTIRATVTARRVAGGPDSSLRVTFERRVVTNQGAARFEALNEPAMYVEFFNLVRQGLARGHST